VGLQVFLVTADGPVMQHPRHLRQAARALKHADRRVARRQKGSRRRKKAVAWRAGKQQQVQRQRRDDHHKAALLLVREYDTMYLEDVQVANMVRNRHLSKSIGDAGWAQLRTILASTAACAGKRVIAIPAHDTSQDGSGCGERVQKRRSVRTPVCPSCGRVLDRDANAAVNIPRAGRAPPARTWPAGAIVA
jgi:putative transposase